MDRREAPVVLAAGTQHYAAGGGVDALHAELPVEETNGLAVIVGLDGLVHNQDVALLHAVAWESHGAHPEEKCRRTAGDQRLREIKGCEFGEGMGAGW